MGDSYCPLEYTINLQICIVSSGEQVWPPRMLLCRKTKKPGTTLL